MKVITLAQAKYAPARSLGFLAPLSIAFAFTARFECPNATAATTQPLKEAASPVKLAPTVEWRAGDSRKFLRLNRLPSQGLAGLD